MTSLRPEPPTGRVRLSASHLVGCVEELEAALRGLADHHPGDMACRIYRSAAVRQFELILEISGKLLRMRLRDWFASNREVDELVFKDVFRVAALFTLIEGDVCERWLKYRDLRNDSAHDYGEKYPDTILSILPRFAEDARALRSAVESRNG